jgi:hypothetical protein
MLSPRLGIVILLGVGFAFAANQAAVRWRNACPSACTRSMAAARSAAVRPD